MKGKIIPTLLKVITLTSAVLLTMCSRTATSSNNQEQLVRLAGITPSGNELSTTYSLMKAILSNAGYCVVPPRHIELPRFAAN